MINKLVRHLPIVWLMILVGLCLVSWVGSIYDWGMNNLLSAKGVRWFFSNFIINFQQSPIATFLFILMALGVVVESDVLSLFFRSKRATSMSIKQRRAMQIMIVVLVLQCVLWAVFILLPSAPLLSPYGTFQDSPLQQGLLPIICITLSVTAASYGYASSRFASIGEIIAASSSVVRHLSSFWFLIFVSSQIIACLQFSVPEQAEQYNLILQLLLYYLPLILYLLIKDPSNSPSWEN